MSVLHYREEGNLRPRCPPCEYTSRGKPEIPPADQIPWIPVIKPGRTPLTLRDSDDVPHCRILSSDEAEWWLILAALCR